MKMPVFFINGKLVSQDKAVIPVTDLSILRGYGIFDFIRTYNGKPFKLREHLKRLLKSAKVIALEIPWSFAQLQKWVYQTLKANSFSEAQIRIVITGGLTKDSLTPLKAPTIIIMVSPLSSYPQSYYEKGVKIITYPLNRFLPQAKSINYLPAIIALKKARKEKALEAVYVDRKGNLLEGTTSNFFAFCGNLLLTAKQGVLTGVTRDTVIQLAKTKFKIKEKKLKIGEIKQFTECFITASGKEIMPVVQIDKQIIGGGLPGPNTRLIMKLFKLYHR